MDAISMQDVAEIYVKRPERNVNNPLANRIHIFMVFLEEDFSLAAKEKSTAKSFTLTEKGLSPTKEYYQPLYDYKSDSFKSLGTFGWFPQLFPKADGSVEFQFINPERQDVLLIINGFDAAGNPFQAQNAFVKESIALPLYPLVCQCRYRPETTNFLLFL